MPSALLRPTAAAAAFCRLGLRSSPPPRSPILPLSAARLSSYCGGAMDGCGHSTVLVLAGKSPQEDDLARFLKSRSDTLKLLDEEAGEVRVLLRSDAYHPTFDSQFYMGALTASRFGRLLIWSPRLPSTHDLVSKWEHRKIPSFLLIPIAWIVSWILSLIFDLWVVDRNFGELPVGTVCVTDVQIKGRGVDRKQNMVFGFFSRGAMKFSFLIKTVYVIWLWRSGEECVGVAHGLPSVLVHVADGRWAKAAAVAVCCVPCGDWGNQGVVPNQCELFHPNYYSSPVPSCYSLFGPRF